MESITLHSNSQNVIKILFVGRLDNQKNPLMLLAVAKEVVKRYPGVMFTIVGDGEQYVKCKDYIYNNNLCNNVFLAGWQNDVQLYYKSHDVFIMTSIYEAFGLIFLEAGFHHLPTVATDVEGIPEVVLHEKTGLLSPPNDIPAMIANVCFLIEHEDVRKRMGDNAFSYVTQRFTSAIMVEKYRQLYEHYKNRLMSEFD